MSTDRIAYDLSNTIARAEALARLVALGASDECNAPDPRTVADVVDTLADLLARAQDLACSLHECELIPIRNLTDLHRVRALRAELGA